MEASLDPAGDVASPNGAGIDERELSNIADSGNADARSGGAGHGYRERTAKPNKVYIGGLPENTRREDLESCFSKIGNIVDIELKTGFGFVEFETREGAEESVAKYNEGHFMGSKIRVELSHGGSRTKYNNDPGACFKCGELGHWARECPNHVIHPGTRRTPSEHSFRGSQHRDYPPRESYGHRESRGNYMAPPPPRESRYGYEYPPRRAASPPPRADYRDYPPRQTDDSRTRGPPPPPPPSGYQSRSGHYPPPSHEDRGGHPPRSYPPPPPRDYERYDRRPPPERYAYAPPQKSGNAPESRGREEYSRPPPREYPPPAGEYRGRPSSPARYGGGEYPPRSAHTNYRRRSQSPPSRAGSGNYESYPPSAQPYAGGAPSSYSQNSGPGREYPPRGESGYKRS